MESIPSDHVAYTTPGVVDELKKYNDTRWMFWEHQVTVTDPSPKSRRNRHRITFHRRFDPALVGRY